MDSDGSSPLSDSIVDDKPTVSEFNLSPTISKKRPKRISKPRKSVKKSKPNVSPPVFKLPENSIPIGIEKTIQPSSLYFIESNGSTPSFVNLLDEMKQTNYNTNAVMNEMKATCEKFDLMASQVKELSTLRDEFCNIRDNFDDLYNDQQLEIPPSPPNSLLIVEPEQKPLKIESKSYHSKKKYDPIVW